MFKKALAYGLVSLAQQLPTMRRHLKPLGMLISPQVFHNRIVSIPMQAGSALQLAHLDESYLAFQLYWRGLDYYEPITRELLQRLLRPGDTFLDLGAHIGFFSLSVGLSVSGLKIIAFEPNPKNFRILEANAAANHLENILCEPLAISDSEGTAVLYLTESDMSASLMKDFQAEDTRQIGNIEVRATTLDNYLRHRNIDGPLVIKVDIEGHEPAFFRGVTATLATQKPDIILEVLYDQDPVLISWLKSLGYHFYPITDEGFIELEAPKLIKRYPFLFLNHLLSVKPKREIATLFDGVAGAIASLNLLETSKHFPKAIWPLLWQDEPAPQNKKTAKIVSYGD
jgi:FkbM family methyltransferase